MIAPSTAEVMADISTGDLFLAIVADIERLIDFLAVHGWWFL